MPIEIRMPELDASMTEADLIAWLVAPGDRVKAGDVIAEIETDKSTVELEAEVGGTVLEIRVAEGTTGVKVGEVLAVLADSERSSVEPPKMESPAPRVDAPAERAEDLPSATALARRIASQEGLDLSDVQGSGRGGRIVKADVEQATRPAEPPSAPVARRPATPEPTPVRAESDETPHILVPHSRMRRTIARRLSEAKQTIPHFYLSVECRVDVLLAVRKRLNAENDDIKLSVNDFVVRAAALALRAVPDANVAWSEEGLLRFERADIAIAVATDGGLVTPIVRGADRKALRALSEETRDLAERARSGRLRPEEYRGGTFSVSNLGMFGIESVYPILNPPQAGILGVGGAVPRPVVEDGQLVVGTQMTCTLAADHRAMDGAVGARLLSAVKERIEDPLAMLL